MSVEQVFLYVTQKCNIRCITCYALDQLERDADLDEAGLLRILEAQRAEGAWRLSFLGGEPTVHPRLREIAAAARGLGFEFVRVNTNGMFSTRWLEAESTRAIDVFCFSIDGSTAEVNDGIRKGAKFERILSNMRRAASLGYDVRANMTVTSRNMHQIRDVIGLVRDAGGSEVNLNVMFQMGYALEREDLSVDPACWRSIYADLVDGSRPVGVRLKVPQAFATALELEQIREEGHRCLAADGSRVYVSSNGDTYPCLVMMDDENRRTGIPGNLADDDGIHDYCHFIKMRSDDFLPLCIFHKVRLPAQQ
jgi:MoaA/NifB/PqqE/SkfB family radical SAM enzyme